MWNRFDIAMGGIHFDVSLCTIDIENNFAQTDIFTQRVALLVFY